MTCICCELHELLTNLTRFEFPFEADDIPRNGIYVLFEKGELGHGGDRIVRVGTHTGENQLRSRLHQHFLKENKDRSIFRKNIGRALLNRDGDPFLKYWEIDLTTRKAKERHGAVVDRDKLQTVEQRVSNYIQDRFSFVVLPVDDKDERLSLESRMISTVSWCDECGPSPDWLGLDSPKQKIRESGLWLVNELYKTSLSERDLLRVNELVTDV